MAGVTGLSDLRGMVSTPISHAILTLALLSLATFLRPMNKNG